MRNFAVLLAMIGGFTILMGPAIGLSLFPEAKSGGPRAEVSSICTQAFAAAGAGAGADRGADALDEAVRSCASVREWEIAARVHPAATGGADPRRVLAARCRDRSAGLGRYATCRDLGDVRVPEPKAGSLAILAPSAPERGVVETGVGVEIILDTSGSMLEKVGRDRRMDIAKDALSRVVRDALTDDQLVAIRTFRSTDEATRRDRASGRASAHRTRDRGPVEDGSEEADRDDLSRCLTELTMPAAPLDRRATLQLVDRLVAGKRTSTPIAASLAAVAEDLAAVSGRRTIVLMTDGNETCGGDPLAEIERLRARWPDLRLHVVGIALDDEELEGRMARLAEAGGGGFFDATDAEELVAALRSAITGKVSVGTRVHIVAEGGDVIGRGRVGGDAIDVAPGTYEVRVVAVPPIVYEDVLIAEGHFVELALPRAD